VAEKEQLFIKINIKEFKEKLMEIILHITSLLKHVLMIIIYKIAMYLKKIFNMLKKTNFILFHQKVIQL
jgi:hypothetical protein